LRDAEARRFATKLGVAVKSQFTNDSDQKGNRRSGVAITPADD